MYRCKEVSPMTLSGSALAVTWQQMATLLVVLAAMVMVTAAAVVAAVVGVAAVAVETVKAVLAVAEISGHSCLAGLTYASFCS